MSITLNKSRKRLLLSLVFVVAGFIGLSSWYYKSLTLDPVIVWHGANLGVRSIVSNDGSSRYNLSHDEEMLERLKKATESDQVDYKPISIEPSLNTRATDIGIKNQIAANKARHAQFENDLSRLKETSEQLLNSKKTLDGLNQDYASVVAYQQAELARQQVIQNALNSEYEVPSESDARDVMVQRGRSANRSSSRIPDKVLNEIQQSTGISPDEINELMNQ